MKKRTKNIEIGAVKCKESRWDFGMIPNADKKLKVDSELWHDFVSARERYEFIYDELKRAVEK